MTPKEFAEAMQEVRDKLKNKSLYDEEDAHFEADDIMCGLLRDLGYSDGVDIFENMPKRYR